MLLTLSVSLCQCGSSKVRGEGQWKGNVKGELVDLVVEDGGLQ